MLKHMLPYRLLIWKTFRKNLWAMTSQIEVYFMKFITIDKMMHAVQYKDFMHVYKSSSHYLDIWINPKPHLSNSPIQFTTRAIKRMTLEEPTCARAHNDTSIIGLPTYETLSVRWLTFRITNDMVNLKLWMSFLLLLYPSYRLWSVLPM